MSRKRIFSVTVATLPCSCGGLLRPRRVNNGRYRVEVELGLRANVTGSWVALRCDQCEKVSLPGSMLEALSEEAVLLLLKLKRRLSGRESQFLRKAALGIGQEELARRLGVSRPTVARWEGDQSLSGEHDFQLRGLVAAHLLGVSRKGPGRWKKRGPQLIELVTGVLKEARTVPAPLQPAPLQIAA